MPGRMLSRLGRAGDGQSGQLVIAAAFVMVVVLGFTALVVDLGLLTHDRRNLQNAADAMALAGASQLKTDASGNSTAIETAMTWSTKNSVDASEVKGIYFNQTCSGQTASNTIMVKLKRTRSTTFARVLGINKADVSVCASATHFSVGGGVGMAPFGVEKTCVFGPDGLPNTGDSGEMHGGSVVTIKYDSQNGSGGGCGSNTGNFWTLAIDSSGGGSNCGFPEPGSLEERKLKDAICFGAITPLCVAAAATAGEDCQTSVDTEPGNNIAAVRSSVQFLVDNVPSDCNTLAKIIQTETVDGTTRYSLNDKCNPFLPGYTGVSLVKMIPVLSGLFPDANGKTNVPIVNFLIVVIDPAQVTAGNWCKGNSCDLQAEIVDIGVNPDAIRQALNDNSLNNFPALVN